MTRQRCHLTEHARCDSIPLRVGRCLPDDKIYLDGCEDDEEGTKHQRPKEIERGNRHVLADLWVAGESQSLGRWRFVLGKPREEWRDPPVVTVLPVDRSAIKSEGTLTEVLKRERESGNHEWLTPQYIATVLKDLYQGGQLSRVEQLTEHIREKDKTPLKLENAELRTKLKATEEEKERVKQVGIEAIDVVDKLEAEKSALTLRVQQLEAAQTANKAPVGRSQAADVRRPAVSVTDRWRSRTNSAQYINIGVEAFLENVEQVESRIRLTFIDSKGASKQIEDFGRINGFVAKVFDYLLSRKGKRAVFLTTYKPGQPLKLASDTMMLDTYKHLWK